MGCGGSTAQQGTTAQNSNNGSSQKYTEKDKKEASPKKEPPTPADSQPRAGGAPAGAAAPAPAKEEAKPAPSPSANAAAAPAAIGSATSAGREKAMPGPLMAQCGIHDVKDSSCLVSAFGNDGDLSGLTVATLNMQTMKAYKVVMDDDELTKVRDGLCATPIKWEVFWKMFATAISKAGPKVEKDGEEVEIKLKQSKGEPKEAVMKLKLEPTNEIFDLFAVHIPRVFAQRRALVEEEAKDQKKDEKKLRETDIAKKEAEYSVHEAVLQAAAEAAQTIEPRVESLRTEAKEALREIGSTQSSIAKTKQVLETLESGAPSHPLDDMYSCKVPDLAEPQPLDVANGWEADVWTMDVPLGDIAVALFEKHGLLEAFSMDRNVVRQFFRGVELKCHDVPFHGKKRAADCLLVMDFVVEQLQKTVKFSKEDILASLVSGAILDLDHEGYDDTYTKRAGSMLSMLYSDVYSINQNNLTVAAEMFYNDATNLMVSLTPDQSKDVIETVREALFIKANVQMKPPMDRLADFKQLSGSSDWGNKDNVRQAITHAVRMVDWSAWGRPAAIHKKLMQMMADEYYRQGDKELSLGLAPSPFFDTCWTTDRAGHDSTFARGQAQFIDEVVLPLFEEMAKLAPGLSVCVENLKANREEFVKEGGVAGELKKALGSMPKAFGSTADGTVLARVGPDGESLWVTLCCKDGKTYTQMYNDVMLAKRGMGNPEDLVNGVVADLRDGKASSSTSDDSATVSVAGVSLDMPKADGDCVVTQLLPSIKSFLELRGVSAPRYIDLKLEDISNRAAAVGNKAGDLKAEEKALKGCLVESAKKIAELKEQYASVRDLLTSKGCPEVTIEIEDELSISVRNPLKAPLPPGVTVAPDRKEVDPELLKIIKSKFFTKEHGAEQDLTQEPGEEAKHCNMIKPYLTSDFCKVTSSIDDQKRQQIYDLLGKLDEWDYNVFDLQTVMSGGIAGENLRNQPDGGSLFITAYALMYKWQFMQKFNIDETVLLNWLSIVEAGYHPNPYHNSMHAADVLHVTHYILGPGGCKDKVKATDEEVFAAIFAAAVHDYNHPGINNAFHVRSQNYLAVLFNDRSVNENIHASSIFELMRMDKFNILTAFTGSAYTKMRDDIVEFILGTDMGLHAMILSRFKKRLEQTDGKMYRAKCDKNLAITMAVKMADINNCGRPQNLYHGWCNVIVDEFFQQGDRERLAGLPVSPFMDRYTTVMAKGQIGFMNYIVMPLFECMGEFLEPMSRASTLAEENKGFWQENEDW